MLARTINNSVFPMENTLKKQNQQYWQRAKLE